MNNQFFTEEFVAAENSISHLQKQLDIVQHEYAVTNEQEYPQLPVEVENPIIHKHILSIRKNIQTTVYLLLTPDVFKTLRQDTLHISEFQIDFSKLKPNENITFSPIIKNLSIINNKISSDVDSHSIIIEDMDTVIIKNIQMKNKKIWNSKLFIIRRVKKLIIEDIIFQNVEIKDSTLFDVLFSQNVSISRFLLEESYLKGNYDDVFRLETNLQVSISTYNFLACQYEGTGKVLAINSIGNQLLEIANIIFSGNQNSSFINNRNNFEQDSKQIQLQQDRLSLTGAVIENCESQLGFSILYIQVQEFVSQNVQIKNNNYPRAKGPSYFFHNIQLFQLSDILVQNVKGQSGSSVYLENCDKPNNFILNSKFLYNEAFSSGGAIMSHNSNFILQNVDIHHNKALIGGGIRFIRRIPDFYFFYYQQKNQNQRILSAQSFSFNNNTALIYADNIGYYPQMINVKQINNKVQLEKLSPTTYVVNEMGSGQNLDLDIQFVDGDGNTVKFDMLNLKNYSQDIQEEMSQLFQIQITNVQNIHDDYQISGITEKSLKDFNQTENSFQFRELSLFNDQKHDLKVGIQSRMIHRLNFDKMIIEQNKDNQIILDVNFRNCVRGELYQSQGQGTYVCYECPQGKYSIQIPVINDNQAKCLPCPQSAANCYRNVIELKNGYWRRQGELLKETHIVFCQNDPSNCKSEDPSSKFHCKRGHIGPMCEECDILGEVWQEEYSREGLGYTCTKCQDFDTFGTIFRLSLTLFAEIWFIQFSLKNVIKMGTNLTYALYLRKLDLIPTVTSAYQDISPFFIKQFFHYSALSKLCNQHTLVVSQYLTYLPNIFKSPIGIFYYSLDCIFKDTKYKRDMVYARTLWTLFIPILYGIILLFCYAIFTLVFRRKFNKYYLITGIMYFIMYLSPGILSSVLQTITCRYVSDQLFITADLTQECGSDKQKQFTNFIGLPVIIFIILVVPALIMRNIKFKTDKNRSEWYTYRIKTGFFSSDLKKSYYYWEFVRMYKKYFLVIFIALNSSRAEVKLIVSSITIYGYYVLSSTLKPYAQKIIQDIDELSMKVLLYLAAFNILIFNSQISFIVDFSKFASIYLDWLYFIYLIFQIARNKMYADYPKQYQAIALKIIKVIPRMKKYISLQKHKSFKVYKNWKRTRTLIRAFLKNNLMDLGEYKKLRILNLEMYYNQKENISSPYGKDYYQEEKSLVSLPYGSQRNLILQKNETPSSDENFEQQISSFLSLESPVVKRKRQFKYSYKSRMNRYLKNQNTSQTSLIQINSCQQLKDSDIIKEKDEQEQLQQSIDYYDINTDRKDKSNLINNNNNNSIQMVDLTDNVRIKNNSFLFPEDPYNEQSLNEINTDRINIRRKNTDDLNDDLRIQNLESNSPEKIMPESNSGSQENLTLTPVHKNNQEQSENANPSEKKLKSLNKILSRKRRYRRPQLSLLQMQEEKSPNQKKFIL